MVLLSYLNLESSKGLVKMLTIYRNIHWWYYIVFYQVLNKIMFDADWCYKLLGNEGKNNIFKLDYSIKYNLKLVNCMLSFICLIFSYFSLVFYLYCLLWIMMVLDPLWDILEARQDESTSRDNGLKLNEDQWHNFILTNQQFKDRWGDIHMLNIFICTIQV